MAAEGFLCLYYSTICQIYQFLFAFIQSRSVDYAWRWL